MDKLLILNELISYYAKGSTTKFANLLGISQQALSNWKKRGTLDYDLIYTKCDNLNPHWLLTGEGEMIVSENVSKSEKCKQSKDMKTEIEEGITQISGLQEKADEFFSRIEKMEKDAKKRDFILERMAATLDGIREDLSKLHEDKNDDGGFSHCG